MHAKVTVADDTVFLGSFNLSRSGEENAENVLEIADAALADRLAALDRRAAGALPGRGQATVGAAQPRALAHAAVDSSSPTPAIAPATR